MWLRSMSNLQRDRDTTSPTPNVMTIRNFLLMLGGYAPYESKKSINDEGIIIIMV